MSQAQTGFYDTKRGWADRGRQVKRCSGLSGLEPGTYRALCGGTIAPGASGLIQVTDCDGTTKTITATNHTNCTFYTGERITAHITPCCTAHFDGCSCCGDAPVCCDRSIAVCMDGQTQIVSLKNTSVVPVRVLFNFLNADPNKCCDNACAYSVAATIDITCSGTTVTADYFISCRDSIGAGGYEYSGTLDWSDLCASPATAIEDVITICNLNTGVCCNVTIVASPSLEAEACDPCGTGTPTPPAGCCTQQLWFCIGGVSQQLALDGGNYTWTITDCVDCTGTATLEADLTCTDNVPILQLTYTCDGGTPEVTAYNLSQFCYSLNPVRFFLTTDDGQIEVNITGTETACDSCGVSVACCAEAVPDTLSLDITGGAYAGSYSLIWDGGLSEWVVDGSAPFTARLSCGAGPAWDLTFEMDNFGTSAETCDPFCLTMDVTGNSHGITAMTIGDCAGGPGGAGGGI